MELCPANHLRPEMAFAGKAVRILILTQYYPPETGAPQNRLSDLARRLAGRGHQVEVLTALPNYPANTIFPEYVGKENTVEVIDEVRVARVGLYVPTEKTFIKRLWNYLSFVWNALRHGHRLISSSADILLWESPPLFLGLAAKPLARNLAAKLVMNVSDLWPQSIVELGIVSPGPVLWAAQGLESWLYQSADLVTGQTEGIVNNIRSRFPGKQVEMFPNGVDTNLFSGQLARDKSRREFNWPENVMVVGYTGLLGHAQALGQVLDAARLLPSNLPVHFAFFGDGPCRQELSSRIEKEGINSAKVYARQPRERMPHIQAALDVGLVPLARGNLFEGARPSKMFEIMAASRPVLLCAAGEAVRILESPLGGAGGLSVPPESPLDLAKAVRKLLENPIAASAMGERGREYVLQKFDRGKIAEHMEKMFMRLIGPAV